MRVAGLLALAAALVALAPAEARATSCEPRLTWRGALYIGGFNARGVDFGSRVGTGLVPDCADTGGEPEPPTPIALLRVAGVRPAIAVGTKPDRALYLAEGFVIESPRHPLHRKLFRRGSPNETRGWTCRPAFARVGRIRTPPPFSVSIAFRRSGRTAQVFVDARTQFDDRLSRFGVPYLAVGTRVRATLTRCTRSRGRSKLVARAFAPVRGATLAG
jgi:hypothetical protein